MSSVEEQFLIQLCLGETILPFRILNPRLIVIPIIDVDTGEVIDSHIARDRGLSGLAGWLEQAERTWDHHKSSNMSLYERINYNGELSVQFPRTDFRMVYPTSGTNLCGAALKDKSVVVDTSAYWISCTYLEAKFLSAVFNAPFFLEQVSKYQSVGLMGTRHFHKHPFRIPIPKFNRTNNLHLQLVDAATRAESMAEAVDLSGISNSTQARRAIRHQLATNGMFTELDRLVAHLLESLDL